MQGLLSGKTLVALMAISLACDGLVWLTPWAFVPAAIAGVLMIALICIRFPPIVLLLVWSGAVAAVSLIVAAPFEYVKAGAAMTLAFGGAPLWPLMGYMIKYADAQKAKR